MVSFCAPLLSHPSPSLSTSSSLSSSSSSSSSTSSSSCSSSQITVVKDGEVLHYQPTTHSSSNQQYSPPSTTSRPTPLAKGDCSYRVEELAYLRSGDKGNTANIGTILHNSYCTGWLMNKTGMLEASVCSIRNVLFIHQLGMKPSLLLPQINPLCMAPLRVERCFRSTPNGVLTAHTSVVCQVRDCSMAVLYLCSIHKGGLRGL